MIKPTADTLFEVSWEICNKVGGIYTVVKSKADRINDKYKNYFLIGPYFKNHADIEFDEETPPEDLISIFEELKNEGIVCHYGSWLIKGEPKTILVDFKGIVSQKDDIKKHLWEDFKIDSMFSNWDFEEPMIWGYAVGRLLDRLSRVYEERKIVVQCHEWLSGFPLLYLKKTNADVGKVFTTHATMLGRSIAGSGDELYGILDHLDPEKEAKKRGVNDKFSVERAAALNADIFTTVSEITAREAEKILGRRAEVLVLNGLDIEKFPTFEETSVKHTNSRKILREFATYYFFPHYTFDMKHALFFFIVGRYEYRNKGIDIFVKALGNLNKKLKEKNSNRTIIAFFWIPTETHGIKVQLLENKTFYRHIKNYVEESEEDRQRRIITELLSGRELTKKTLFTKVFLQQTKRDVLGFRRKGNPMFSTHNLNNEENDEIISHFKKEGLNNLKEDKVKVISYPVYLTGADGLLDLPYYDAMVGCHLGVFPSYYEPWGYTPLESAALGVPAITSDLSGFGKFIENKTSKQVSSGIFVLKRENRSEKEVVEDFTQMLYTYSTLNHHNRVKNKMDAKKIANLADWKILIENYIKAHNQSLEKKK